MKLLRSFVYAWSGIKACFITERNFRIHFFATLIVLVFSIVLHLSTGEWMAVIFCTGFVITMEMMNTAIEKLCNVGHPDIHPGIKKVKDISAGAVLISAMISSITGIMIFLPKIIKYIN